MRRGTAPRTVIWASSRPPGVERCTITRAASGWVLAGSLVRRFGAGPAAISYVIETDRGWKTRRVHVEQTIRGKDASLDLEAKGPMWYVEGKRDGRLDGCTDVDLGASPATNTLPIRRAKPEVGARIDLTVAWVRFPGLSVEPLRQSYERTEDRLYVYRSASGFESEIEVDASGMVRAYGDYWQAVQDR